jgi:hypothetical protein
MKYDNGVKEVIPYLSRIFLISHHIFHPSDDS